MTYYPEENTALPTTESQIESLQRLLAEKNETIANLKALLREARDWLDPCEIGPDGNVASDYSCHKHPNALCREIDAALEPKTP